MNKKQLEQLKQILIQRKQEILTKVGASTEDIGDLQGETATDWVDRVSLDDAMNSLMSKESELARELEDIVEALEKMERGEYGICEECGQEIAFERLEAVPTAKLCVPCKSKKEKSEFRGYNQRGPSSIPSELFDDEWYE
jgi:DnaK suppressor protein